MFKQRGLLAAALIVPLVGCATQGTPPRAELAQAEQAIEAAASADANQFAPMALREARAKVDKAREAAYAREFERARFFAREAQVSAELALAQAQTKQTEQLAQEALAGVETLRQELNRKEATQ